MRGLTPINNPGGGNCVFMSLALQVFGDAATFKFMRYMIAHRLKSFPAKYRGKIKNFSSYCNTMALNNQPASALELQVAADLFLIVIECYSIEDYFLPYKSIRPERLPQS